MSVLTEGSTVDPTKDVSARVSRASETDEDYCNKSQHMPDPNSGAKVQYLERAGGMTHDLLVQAAGRLTFTSTFRPAWVSMVTRVSRLKRSIFPRIRSLIRG